MRGMKTAVVVPCSNAQSSRKLLEEEGLLDKTRKLETQSKNSVAIPVVTNNQRLLQHALGVEGSVAVTETTLPPSKGSQTVGPAGRLRAAAWHLLQQCCVCEARREALMREVPTGWEKHGDVVLLPAASFVSQEWNKLGARLWTQVAISTGALRVARQAGIAPDGFRTPQVTLLLGESGVVQHVDNGIRYEYDITRCMFSAGNITEKLRIARFNCQGETVVDLYAGIGYFTLPYLVHAGATHVYACEWNPDSVAALKRNLELNRVNARCSVHQGDNRQLPLRAVADRVNLGLLPSSEEGWPVACRVLKPTGGVLHIHGNVNTRTAACEHLQPQHSQGARHKLPHASQEGAIATAQANTGSRQNTLLQTGEKRAAWQMWGQSVCASVRRMLVREQGGSWQTCLAHIQHVKSYAPHVSHLVADVQCMPCP